MICKGCNKQRNKLSENGYCGWCEARINGKERICKQCNKTFLAHDRKQICYECRERLEKEKEEAKKRRESEKRDPENCTCPVCSRVFDNIAGLHCHLPTHDDNYQKRQFSEETRKKMSASAKGKKHGPLSQSQRDAIILSNKTRLVSEETKEKIRQKAIGRSLSESTKEKLRIASTGRIKTEEERIKLSKAHKGKVVSKETRQKLSIAARKRMLDPEKRKNAFGMANLTFEERSARVKKAKRHGWTEEAKKFCDNKDYAIQILDSFDERPTYADVCDKLGCFTQQVEVAIRNFGLQDRVKIGGGTSNIEKELFDFVKSLNDKAIKNDRKTLNGIELDIYIPDKNLAIELNGMYWHNEDFRNSQYHLNKTMLCQDRGIRLIHVFEWEWNWKKDIVKSMIMSAMGMSMRIYARQCTVKEIDSKISADFLDKNHIQGNVNASKRLGLYHDDCLVAVMTFGKPRFKAYDGIEMLRYAVKQGLSIAGGMSKLLSHAMQLWRFNKVLSYCNISKFTGKSYEAIGFKMIRQTPPNYWWCNSGTCDILTRYQTQMKDEVNIMKDKGYRRVWDCGSKVYELTV